MGAGAPPDDDDPERDWQDNGDTVVQLDQDDLSELEETTPARGPEALPGYELGRRAEQLAIFQRWQHVLDAEWHRGAAAVLHAVRDHMIDDGAEQGIADEIIKRLAKRVGVKLV